MNLIKLYKSLILEGVNRADIEDAIEGQYRVRIWYEGDDNTAPGMRAVIMYAYGLSKAGNPVVRAYQVFGDTKTKKPAWKLFRLDRITRMEKTNLKYYKPISDYDSRIPKFNPYGDKTMSRVFKIANFNKSNNEEIKQEE
jgi:hypothetical protein